MESNNDPQNSKDGAKKSVVAQAGDSTILNNTPVKPTLDDMELNEEQLDIISGGGDPAFLGTGGKP